MYFCNKKAPILKRNSIFILFCLLLTAACTQRQSPSTPPWQGSAATSDAFDLSRIQQAGELIALTVSGPDTYYDYMGRHLGVHYLLAEQFAAYLGVRLRVEVCRDTIEVLSRLAVGDADMSILPPSTPLDERTSQAQDLAATDSVHGVEPLPPGWRVGVGKPELTATLQQWYRPDMLAAARHHEQQLLNQQRVRRRVSAPMLRAGVISHYDHLFRRYSRQAGCDWRLLAAQCYQESTFDPAAQSWAGACGLMQIMPSTADHLGLSRDQMTDPEANIEAATRLIAELHQAFADIADRTERQNFVLAAYNGGVNHIRDAQRLALRDGRDAHRWTEVSPYVLRLSDPRYYQDSLVRYGYMRGSETVDYVAKIQQRYKEYRMKIPR